MSINKELKEVSSILRIMPCMCLRKIVIKHIKKNGLKSPRKWIGQIFGNEILLHFGVPDNQILLRFGVPDNQILLHFSVPNNQILLRFGVPDNQILLHFGVPDNCAMNISS